MLDIHSSSFSPFLILRELLHKRFARDLMIRLDISFAIFYTVAPIYGQKALTSYRVVFRQSYEPLRDSHLGGVFEALDSDEI